MKKIKILMIMLISILIVLCMNNISYGVYDTWESLEPHLQKAVKEAENFKNAGYGIESVGKKLMMGNTTLRWTDEIYCLSHKQGISFSEYEIVKYMEIDGKTATIPGVASRDANCNIKLALVLSTMGNQYVEPIGAPVGNYSTAQKALWMYLRDWLEWDPDGSGPEVTNKELFGFDESYGDEEIRDWSNEEERQIAEDGYAALSKIENQVATDAHEGKLDKYTTKVRLYFLEGDKSYQKLLIAVPEEPVSTKAGLIIDKVDEETEEPLSKVSFIIKNDTTGEYISSYSDESVEYSPDRSDALEFTTGISIYKQIVIQGLTAGTYIIEETRNPNEGYNTDDNDNIGRTWMVELKDKEVLEIKLTNYKEPPPPTINPGAGNVTVSGTVWEDLFTGKGNTNNGQIDKGENGIEGVIVYWKDSKGNVLASTITDKNGNYTMKQKITIDNHTYSIDKTQYDNLNNSYIEFEYNGLKYTTVAPVSKPTESQSIGIELEGTRNSLDNKFSEIISNEVKDKNGNKAFRLSYNSSNHVATLKQDNSDFPVKANTKKVSNLLSYASTETSRYCVCHKKHYPAGHGPKCSGHRHYYSSCYAYKVDEWHVYNMNLGLVKREQPDLAITSDINKVRVIMKGQEYTYYYRSRGISAPSDALFDYKVKFSGKYDQIYKRPVNPADIGYVNYNNSADLEVYVTYEINVKNQSNTLPVEVKEIVNYYDANYTPTDASLQKWSYTSKYGDNYNKNNGEYNAVYTQQLSGTIIQPQSMLKDPILVEYKVNNDVVQNVMNEDAFLHNVSEIYIYSSYYGGNTLCAENEKANQKTWYVKDKSQYAGIDKDSQPGSAIPGKLETYEDDTDQAPTFALVKDPNYKIISGTVWEDTDYNTTDDERIGNGKYDAGSENVVEGVQVELLRIKDDGTTEPAYLYYISGGKAERRLAVTWTDNKGNYTFGENSSEGVAVDNYIIRYTYGNDTTIEIPGNSNGTDVTVHSRQLNTKINDPNGNSIENNVINARNYKSTIIASSPLKEVMKGSGYTIDADEWHLNHTDGYSVAVDNIEERKAISSLIYDNFDTPVNMTAYTEPFKVQIEYDTKSQESTLKQDITNYKGVEAEEKVDAYGNKNKQYMDISVANIEGLEFTSEGNQTSGDFTRGKDYENDWEKFDFGIIERPREDIVIDKTIENFKITLANGQVLTEGKPYGEDNMPYVKALGTTNVTTRNRSIGANDKLLYIEMDSELIQGARIDIKYAITVTNNSEKDYEYDYDYSGKIEANNYIVKDNKIYYYYYGENKVNGTELKIIKSTVEWVVDYMDPELTCSVESILSDNNDTTITLEGVLSSISSNNDMIKRNNDLSIDDVNNVNGGTYTYEENKGTRVNGVPNWIQITPLMSGSGSVEKTSAKRLYESGLISEATMNRLQEGNYSIFITDYFYDVTYDDPNTTTKENTKTLNLFASKLLANQAADYTYENHVEILQLNGKIARNIDSTESTGKQVTKTYKPGTYIPNLERIKASYDEATDERNKDQILPDDKISRLLTDGTIEQAGLHNQDDDMITIRITPPTGLENNMIIYISVGVVGLIVIAVGIYFIKKKVIG